MPGRGRRGRSSTMTAIGGTTVACAVGDAEHDAALVEVAGVLASKLGLAIDLVHVNRLTDMAMGGMGAAPVAVVLEEPPDAALQMRLRLHKLADEAGCPSAACEVVAGEPTMMLERLSRRRDVAMVVVGDRGDGALRAAMRRSVARSLLRTSSRPVLVVPSGASAPIVERPGPVVCAVDEDDASPIVASAAAGLAQALETELLVVHVVADRRVPERDPARALQVEALLDRCLAEVPDAVSSKGIALLGDPVEGMVELLDDAGASVVVAGPPSHGPVRSVVGGSFCDSLLSRLGEQLFMLVPPAGG